MLVFVFTDMTVQPVNGNVVVSKNHPMTIIQSENKCDILTHVYVFVETMNFCATLQKTHCHNVSVASSNKVKTNVSWIVRQMCSNGKFHLLGNGGKNNGADKRK